MFKALAAFILAHIALFGGGTNTRVYVAPTAGTTSITTVETTTPIVTTKKVANATTTPKAKTVVKKTETKVTPKVKTPVSQKVVTPHAPLPPEPVPDFVAINTASRGAIINIICSSKGGELSPVTGTGIVVSSQGLILTNAHIGQYFLLKDFRQKNYIECVARTGSPAYPKYHLELVYISPTWVANNTTLLKEQNPQGTGENDFAFLRVTNQMDGSAIQEPLPYLPMNAREVILPGEPTLLASYPAGFLGGLSVLQDLSVVTAVTNISEIFTFKETTVDLVSVPGTVVSQKGSSGGAVVDKNTSLIGVISTSSDGKTTSERDLRAITVAHINRSLQTELKMTLGEFVNQDIPAFAKKFQEINAPTLTKLITDELNKNQ